MNLDPTTAAEAGFSIDKIKELMDGVDPAALLPELDTIFSKTALVCRIAILLGPILLLGLGLAYLLLAPKEANWYFGYKTYFGMGSEKAWRFTQRIAGLVLGGAGLVLTIVMLGICAGMGKLDAMDMVWKAVHCLAWEAGVALAATLAINLTAALVFDRKGELRKKT